MSGIRAVMGFGSLFVALQFSGTAFAQASESAKLQLPSRSASVTAQQLQAFADLTGDTPRTISLRMAHDSNLAPLIVSAADARKSRRRGGGAMTAVGFTILGIGQIVGSAIMLSTPGYPDISGHVGQFYEGAAIAACSAVVGLLIGIPGIIKMVSPGEEEKDALDYYAPWRSADVSLRRSDVPSAAPGALSVPLLSGTF
jgi:hypothetical protein